jgi:hypothetical protein
MASKRASKHSKTIELSLRVVNSRDETLSFVLEPWGDVHDFGPGDQITLVFQGPPGDVPEVDVTNEAVTVYGWTGSTVQLYRTGVEIGDGEPERTAASDAPYAREDAVARSNIGNTVPAKRTKAELYELLVASGLSEDDARLLVEHAYTIL